MSDCNVTEIVPNRYLFRGKNFEPWYAMDTPDPEIVAVARCDFGQMILTPNTMPHYK